MTIASGPAKRPKPDGAHLDEDAECLEDPVHCGDARHQHEAHSTKPASAATGETSQS